MKNWLTRMCLSAGVLLLSCPAAHAQAQEVSLELMGHWAAVLSLVVFAVAYALVIFEETTHLRKSKPVMVAAGVIWMLAALTYAANGETEAAEELVRHGLLEFVELFLFLLAAMTYINTMDERGVFDVLRARLLALGLSLRQLFWAATWRPASR